MVKKYLKKSNISMENTIIMKYMNGQVHWKEWYKYLPNHWQLLYEWPNDVLLENLDYR